MQPTVADCLDGECANISVSLSLFLLLLCKAFRERSGDPLGPLRNTNSPLPACEDWPPTSASGPRLSVLTGKGGTACLARTSQREWYNLGCFFILFQPRFLS